MRTFFSIALLLFSFCAFAQEKNDKINTIRKTVLQINKDTGYIIKKLDNDEFLQEATDNGGKVKGYFKGGRLVKIIEWIGLSSCVEITEYYLHNNKLIFTYTKGSQSPYNDSLQTLDDSKSEKKMECRFYFDNEKVIKKIINGSTRCSGEPTIALAKNYLIECTRYKKLFARK